MELVYISELIAILAMTNTKLRYAAIGSSSERKLQEILPCQVSRGETLFVESNTTDDSSPHYDHVCLLSSIVTQEKMSDYHKCCFLL